MGGGGGGERRQRGGWTPETGNKINNDTERATRRNGARLKKSGTGPD